MGVTSIEIRSQRLFTTAYAINQGTPIPRGLGVAGRGWLVPTPFSKYWTYRQGAKQATISQMHSLTCEGTLEWHDLHSLLRHTTTNKLIVRSKRQVPLHEGTGAAAESRCPGH